MARRLSPNNAVRKGERDRPGRSVRRLAEQIVSQIPFTISCSDQLGRALPARRRDADGSGRDDRAPHELKDERDSGPIICRPLSSGTNTVSASEGKANRDAQGEPEATVVNHGRVRYIFRVARSCSQMMSRFPG